MKTVQETSNHSMNHARHLSMQAQHRDALDLAIAYLDSLTNGARGATESPGESKMEIDLGRNLEENLMLKMSQHTKREIKTPLDLDKIVDNCLLRSSEA